jgi:hypothetical protein
MVGELKTINVWVDQEHAGSGRWSIPQEFFRTEFFRTEFFRTEFFRTEVFRM